VRKYVIIFITVLIFAACAPQSEIGTVDIARIVANWPTFQQYQNQLLIDQQHIAQSKEPQAKKMQDAGKLQAKYSAITDQLTSQIKDAAAKIAQQKNLKLVVTKEGVGYGGVDITADVEKAMNITEASPSPSGSPGT
jgi:Skp family chaperone for outer membrane proteins